VAPEVRDRTEEDFNQARPLGEHHVDAKAAGVRLKAILASKGFSVGEEIEGFGLERSEGDVNLECDVVVVGSGSGGGVMAAALAKEGLKVVVLEKGEYFAAQDFTTLEGPGMVRLLEKQGCLATDDGGVALIAGKTVGGGTAINWCVSFKTPDHVRREWVDEHGLELFNTHRYDLAMQAVWDRLAVQPAIDQHNLQNTVLLDGCKKLGLHHGTLERNAPSDHYCGWCCYGCPSGKKQSTAQTWLVDAANTNNTLILSNCNADLIFHAPNPNPNSKKGRTAHGVAATIGNGPARIFIKAKATVVACGALMTPVLLLRSGFSNPNIGKYLRLHPASTTYGYFPSGPVPEGKSYEGGIMTVYSPVNLRNPTDYGGLLETGVFHPAVFAAFHPWRSGADSKSRLLRHARTSHITIVTRDKGSGTVKLDKEHLPIFNYSISKYDEESLVAGIVQSLRVFIAAGAVEVGTQQLDGERFIVDGTKLLSYYICVIPGRYLLYTRVILAIYMGDTLIIFML
jgi:long-chain-alcohol oxidase